MDVTLSLYTRQQLGELAGLDDATLNYWSRESLLVPTEGGSGRGSHRRFNFVQVNIAALLGQVRRFGLNIAMLRSFAELLQDAARLGAEARLHPANYDEAARLATKLDQFRAGIPVMIRPNERADLPTDLRGAALSDWLRTERLAESEAEIIMDVLGPRNDYDPIDAIVAAAQRMGPGRETQAQLCCDLVCQLLAPGYSGAYSWLLGFAPDEGWRIEFGDEGGKFFDRLGSSSPEDFGPGIFLPVSGVIRRVWGLKTPAEHRRDRKAEWALSKAEDVRAKLLDAGIHATVIPGTDPDDGFRVDAPGVEWGAVEAVLNKMGYVTRQPYHTATEVEGE